MEPKKEKEIISRKLYNKILKGIELQDIYYVTGKFSIAREALSQNSDIKITKNAKFDVLSKNFVRLSHTYKLHVINKESNKRCINIECTFGLDLQSNEEFTEEFFEIFKEINLPINTWPFFREHVFNITSKMNIPPLTLPLFRSIF